MHLSKEKPWISFFKRGLTSLKKPHRSDIYSSLFLIPCHIYFIWLSIKYSSSYMLQLSRKISQIKPFAEIELTKDIFVYMTVSWEWTLKDVSQTRIPFCLFSVCSLPCCCHSTKATTDHKTNRNNGEKIQSVIKIIWSWHWLYRQKMMSEVIFLLYYAILLTSF